MEIEIISKDNIQQLTELVLELWTDCDFDEAMGDYKKIIGAENEVCYLVKTQDIYVGFIHLSLRNDWVEGANSFPVAYIEGIYVKPPYQNRGLARKLVEFGEHWGKQKGCKQLASDTEMGNLISIDFHGKMDFEEASRIVCFIKEL
jgi:aminoglycoside 6'-N-acetyltransferase I